MKYEGEHGMFLVLKNFASNRFYLMLQNVDFDDDEDDFNMGDDNDGEYLAITGWMIAVLWNTPFEMC